MLSFVWKANQKGRRKIVGILILASQQKSVKATKKTTQEQKTRRTLGTGPGGRGGAGGQEQGSKTGEGQLPLYERDF